MFMPSGPPCSQIDQIVLQKTAYQSVFHFNVRTRQDADYYTTMAKYTFLHQLILLLHQVV